MSAPRLETQGRPWPLGRQQILAFLIVGCLLLPFYRFELNPDGISYLSIAQQYADGHWHAALNAYWGPLYSWLLALLLLVHIPGILATRIIGLVSGVIAIHALAGLLKRLPLRPDLQQVFLWLAALVVLSYVLATNTPDLLFSALLLLYLSVIFDPDYRSSLHSGTACGILGGLAFYTKSYGFAFFLCHFCLFSFIAWRMNRDNFARRRIVQQFAMGLAYFLVLSAIWITALHGKYSGWSLGTTGEFNHRLVGPASSGYPHLRGLIRPVGADAITAWHDPAPSSLPAWSPMGAGSVHELKLIWRNVKQVLYFWGRESIFFPLFLAFYIALCFAKPKYRWEWLYPVLTIALFTGGYALLTVQDRYFWPVELLLIVVAFRCLHLLFEERISSSSLQKVLIAIVVLSFAVSPLRTFRGRFRVDAPLYFEAQAIKRTGQVHRPFASCDNWPQSAYLAYFLHEPYYGIIVPEPDADEIARALNPDFKASTTPLPPIDAIRQSISSAHIKSLVVWPDCPVNLDSLGPVAAQVGNVRVVEVNQ